MKLFKFRVLSSENKDFVRDIVIPDSQRFYDLHMAIQAACKYDFTQMTSFYLSDESWEKGDEISMMAMDPDSTDADTPYYMKDVFLSDLIKEENQRLLYLFDFFSVRMLFIELVDQWEANEAEAEQKYPQCPLSEGDAPEMMKIDDSMSADAMLNDFEDEFGNEFDDEFGDEFSGSFDNIDDLDI